jgi:hypothetical protein
MRKSLRRPWNIIRMSAGSYKIRNSSAPRCEVGLPMLICRNQTPSPGLPVQGKRMAQHVLRKCTAILALSALGLRVGPKRSESLYPISAGLASRSRPLPAPDVQGRSLDPSQAEFNELHSISPRTSPRHDTDSPQLVFISQKRDILGVIHPYPSSLHHGASSENKSAKTHMTMAIAAVHFAKTRYVSRSTVELAHWA